jgi:hypothetical protein
MIRCGGQARVFAAATAAAAAWVTPAHSDCTCRALGRAFALGESACLITPAGPRLATCGMMLNNTSWLFSETAQAVSERGATGATRLARISGDSVQGPAVPLMQSACLHGYACKQSASHRQPGLDRGGT